MTKKDRTALLRAASDLASAARRLEKVEGYATGFYVGRGHNADHWTTGDLRDLADELTYRASDA